MALVALVCVSAAWSGGAAAAPARPFLWQCEQIHLDQAKDACYLRLLLEDINRSGDPATELPRIDRLARAAGTRPLRPLPPAHAHRRARVGGRAPPDDRAAPERRAALERPRLLRGLRHGPRDVPRPEDHLDRRQERDSRVQRAADAVPAVHVRAQPRPCAHARLSRDALPRRAGMRASRRAGTRRIASRVRSTTTGSRSAAPTTRCRRCRSSARRGKLCAQYSRWAVQCWYRYFIEQSPGPIVQSARDLTSLCSGLAGAQRIGCIAGAAKDDIDDPVAQTRLCAALHTRADALACLRGVANQVYAGAPKKQLALFRAVRAHAGGRARRLRLVVRADVQRRDERDVPRAGVPVRRPRGQSRLRGGCAPVACAARDVLLGGRRDGSGRRR